MRGSGTGLVGIGRIPGLRLGPEHSLRCGNVPTSTPVLFVWPFFLLSGLFEVATAALLHIGARRLLVHGSRQRLDRAHLAGEPGPRGCRWAPGRFTAAEMGSADAMSTALEVAAGALLLLGITKKGGDASKRAVRS